MEGTAADLYDRRSGELLESDRQRALGATRREAHSSEVHDLHRENARLEHLVAATPLDNRLLKRSVTDYASATIDLATRIDRCIFMTENSMQTKLLSTLFCVALTASTAAYAGDKEALIASAESAAPPAVTAAATIKAVDGTILREGSNGYTCYPQQEGMGPMCNDAVWDALIHAVMKKESFKVDRISVSYMLAGEGTAPGVSNSDPYATDPGQSNDWVKEGPHLMIAVPDRTMLEGLSTNPNDPVYVMWKDTPYAHIMVKIAANQE